MKATYSKEQETLQEYFLHSDAQKHARTVTTFVKRYHPDLYRFIQEDHAMPLERKWNQCAKEVYRKAKAYLQENPFEEPEHQACPEILLDCQEVVRILEKYQHTPDQAEYIIEMSERIRRMTPGSVEHETTRWVGKEGKPFRVTTRFITELQ